MCKDCRFNFRYGGAGGADTSATKQIQIYVQDGAYTFDSCEFSLMETSDGTISTFLWTNGRIETLFDRDDLYKYWGIGKFVNCKIEK